ncbi:MAG: GNAT family N-acetyltransferase [Bacillales bacterium]|jgi:ribosomal protein S18 acetylase RimI-like enzyme|nr:GNAT family N-acetyltransferase [Bacillales bacterium]
MIFIKANENTRKQMSSVFIDGFYEEISFINKDKNKLINGFAHMFILDTFYLALDNKQVIGIAGINKNNLPTVILKKKELIKHFGLFKGLLAYYKLNNEFTKKIYPFPLNDKIGVLEFISVKEENRLQGVAFNLINFIIKESAYKQFILEVYETNTKALNLYQKLGFQQFQTDNAFLYLKKSKLTP